LNDDYNRYWEEGLKPFQNLGNQLREADLVVGNLECLARGDSGTNPLRPYALTAELETLGYLEDIHLGLACLANNHIYDNLDDGLHKTLSYLDSQGIAYMGASLDGKESEPYIFCHNELKIGILNYVAKDTNPKVPQGTMIRVNWMDPLLMFEDIRKLREQVDYIVIFPHWGGKMEGSMYPESALRELAHKLIDSGADLIVGHHSHTLQPYEIYNGKHIYYSLGNFCFSDVYKDGIKSESDYARTRRSMILSVNFSKEGYKVRHTGIINTGKQIQLQSKSDLKLPDLSNKTFWLHKQPFWSIYFFYEKNLYKILRHFFANGRNPLRQLFKIKLANIQKAAHNIIQTIKAPK